MQASSWKHDYTVLTSSSDLVSLVSSHIGNTCHEMSDGELIPSVHVPNYVGVVHGRKQTADHLPEELGTAVELALKLWLWYIQQTSEMDLHGLHSVDGLPVWLMLNVGIMV